MRRSRWLSWGGAVVLALVAGACGGGGGGEADHESDREGTDLTGPSATASNPAPAPTPTPAANPAPTPAPAPGGGTTATAIAYEPDVRPVLAADCLRCHSEMGSYAGVMQYVQPGNASSALVRATQKGGTMYGHFSGDPAAKSALIRAWVVDNGAAAAR